MTVAKEHWGQAKTSVRDDSNSVSGDKETGEKLQLAWEEEEPEIKGTFQKINKVSLSK